ncbi:MAG TPA: hypothetical protein VHA07_08375, partial [Devosia sp.]|nr:hypothetical protein [Devosia sp.]
MEQDKIDVSRATPVTETGTSTGKPVRRGAPLWLQIVLSLIVIFVALAIAALFNPTANGLAGRIGVALPLLTGGADDGAAPAQQGQGQRQAQGGGQTAQ